VLWNVIFNHLPALSTPAKGDSIIYSAALTSKEKQVKILTENQFAGKISGMENWPCTREEFERLKAFYETFKKLTKQPGKVADFEFEKQKLLCNVEKLWPLIEKLCKQFDISLEREKIEEVREQAFRGFARGMSGKTDPPELKFQPQKKELITLALVKSEICSCPKPGDSDESPIYPENLAAQSIAKIKLPMHIQRRDKITQILAAVLARLSGYFDEEIETQSSSQKPAETEQKTALAKHWWIPTCLGKIIEKGLYIFTKSFWDSVLERWGPKQ